MIKRLYDKRLEQYGRLKNEVEFILERNLKQENIPHHIITSRIKDFDSFLNKARRGEFNNPIEDIHDVCGIRIISLFLSDLERIGELIMRNFDIIETKDKIQESSPEFFGYMAIHLIAKLPDDFTGPRYDDLKDLNCEIQVRTITMDVWANISHYLDYKSSVAVPSELRKDFHALSGMFYVADSHFEMFFREGEKAREAATAKAATTPCLADEEINLDTLTVFLAVRYPDRQRAGSTYVSALVEELIKAEYTTVRQVQEDLARTEKAFRLYEKEHPPIPGQRYTAVGMVRASLEILGGSFLEVRKTKEGSALFRTRISYRHLVE